MLELTGFDKMMFDVKRKRANEQIKNVVRYGKLVDDDRKLNEAIHIVEMYLGKYFSKCGDEREALELVNKVTLLRKEPIKLKRLIAAKVYEYSVAQ
jgi:hypothetical protein